MCWGKHFILLGHLFSGFLVNLLQCVHFLKSSILRAMFRCMMQTAFVVNTCVTALIYIIGAFVSYVLIENKLSNLFSQGIISNICWFGNVTRVTEIWIFLHSEMNFLF